MDHSFFLRAGRLLDRERPAPVDHFMLRAALAAHQADSPTAREEARLRRQGEPGGGAEPLPELILGGRCWRDAAASQGGCFNRAVAGQDVNEA